MIRPFGSILKDALPITLMTADSIKMRIENRPFARLGLSIFGIPHLGLRLRHSSVIRLLKADSEGDFLDAGCGVGLYCLTHAGRFRMLSGIDNDQEKIEMACRLTKSLKLSNLDFKVGDVRNLPFQDESFDCVLCSEVIEHVVEDEMVIRELSRVLKQKGILVLTTTSKINLNRGLKDNFHHARIGYSASELYRLLQNSGLEVCFFRPYGLFFGQIAWRINRACFISRVLTALSFYPLIILSMLDIFLPENEGANCIGYIVKLRKA